MTVDFDNLLGKAPIGLGEIPQQEIFLEVRDTAGQNSRIYLNDINEMSDSVLYGFAQYVSGQLAALLTAIECYWLNPRSDKKSQADCGSYKKLVFKKKIYSFFQREIDKEKYFRKKEKDFVRPSNSENSPKAVWLKKYRLPDEPEAFECVFNQGRKFAESISSLVRQLSKEVGQDRFEELMKHNRFKLLTPLEIQSESLAVYLAAPRKRLSYNRLAATELE